MAVKVAINGFGRIGRLAFRQMFAAEGYEVVAINDLTSPKMLAHLLKYDTAQGGYCGKIGEGKHTVEAKENSIVVDGKEIVIYAVKDAKEIPWGKHDVDVVLECTGFYTSKEKASAHLEAGAKKVVISAPAGNDLPTIVYNVNHTTLTPDVKVLSAASCTTNCLAPMTQALHKLAPIQSGIMATIHANVKAISAAAVQVHAILFLTAQAQQKLLVWLFLNLKANSLARHSAFLLLPAQQLFFSQLLKAKLPKNKLTTL